MEHFEGFELVEEEHDYIVVDKDQPGRKQQTLVISSDPPTVLHYDYEQLLYKNRIVSTQLKKIVYSLEKEGVRGNNRDLWVAAANCVIKCMTDVIIEGEKLLTEKS